MNIKEQLKLLELEKKEDYRQYQAKMMNASIQEREKDGVTWYPVKLVRDYISTGERITLDLEKTKNFQYKHSFQVGSIVGLFTGINEKGQSVSGVVSYLREHMMRVVLNQSSLPDWAYEEKIGVNLLFDDNTYKDMQKALVDVMEAKNTRLAALRDIFYGAIKASFTNGHTYELPGLNKMQNQAFTRISEAQDVALVHGPPGTGKTTTLVKCIKDTVKQEKQVLVCAPSNAAVDLLVEKLVEEQLNVVRIGHPARLTAEVIENSMDVRISKHPDFSRLKEMRKQSEEYRNLARKYKRHFGKSERIQRDLLFKESKELKNQSRELESYISEHLLDHAEVVACTLTGSNNQLLKDRAFKTIFIDEASQSLEAACWIPLNRVQKVVMSGDHFQLPPTIKSIEAARSGLEKTLFAKGVENQPEAATMLETQYRMEPEIMNFSSREFYQGRLKAANAILERPKFYASPIEFIDTAGAGFNESLKKETLSTYNEQEAQFLVDFIANDLKDGLQAGIITPYKAQIELINQKINQSGLGISGDRLSVNTVDAFQGQERDAIYISLVRSNEQGQIGFLKEIRRMNVAMTRAKYRLVVVGDSSTLGNDPFFGRMLDYFQTEGKYSSVYEYMSY